MRWRATLRSTALNVLLPVMAVALALGTMAIILVVSGEDAMSAFRSMLRAAFGDSFATSTTLMKAMPRLFAALGIALALRAGLWNIGAEGQLYMGAAAATGMALFGPQLGVFTIALALIAGAAAGAGWAAIPGVLRARRGISEVITSLMLVYVAIQFVNYLTEGPWLLPGSTFPASEVIPGEARLPIIWGGTLLNAGVIIGLAAVVFAWFLVSRTTFGLRLRAVGGNNRAASFAGIQVPTMIFVAMALSGAFAGLGAGVEVLGVRGRLIQGFSPGYGFEAIAIALLGRLQPPGVLAAAVLFGALDAGGAGLQVAARGVPSAIVQITVALAVIYVLIGFGAYELWQRRRRAREAIKAAHAAEEVGAEASPDPETVKA